MRELIEVIPAELLAAVMGGTPGAPDPSIDGLKNIPKTVANFISEGLTGGNWHAFGDGPWGKYRHDVAVIWHSNWG
jgi:hypothetical protein